MKKVLVIGAGGTIGLCLLKFLLAEGKYEITAVDLKNNKSIKKLKKYRNRINIIYSDCLDRSLIDNLIKDHDYVYNLATCLPPLAEYKKGLCDIIETNVTENIIKAINYYNPNCHLIYGSSTSVYGSDNINNEINIDKLDYFNNAKVKTEKLIMKKCKNYTIVRVPLVLSDLRTDPFLYNIKKGSYIECITKEDAAYAFCKIIDKDKIVNRKILDIGLIRVNFNDLKNNILKYHGISFKYILSTIFEEKNYYSPVLSNSEKSNEILKYKNDSIESYYMRLKRRSRKRKINILIGKIILKIKRVK